jgi:CheY-like chemotaxis protein
MEHMSPTRRRETILVVDDEQMVLGLADSMLTRFGYTVVTAASGREALRVFEKIPNIEVHLALVDLVMPGMNGIEVVERIHERRPGLPVLYFSAYSEDDSLRPMFMRGAPFLAKPFTSLQLTQKLREMLDKPKADAENA